MEDKCENCWHLRNDGLYTKPFCRKHRRFKKLNNKCKHFLEKNKNNENSFI